MPRTIGHYNLFFVGVQIWAFGSLMSTGTGAFDSSMEWQLQKAKASSLKRLSETCKFPAVAGEDG